jgi:hypothetical protein
VQILSGDDQRQYVLAILSAAKAGDRDRTAILLEQACKRGAGMAEAGRWLRGELYRELLGLRVSIPDNEPAFETAGTSQDECSEEPTKPEGMPWREAADRMERLRTQGERFTSQQKLAEQLGCSAATIHKAIQNTPSLREWANRPPAALRAQSLTPWKKGEGHIDVVTERAPQRREPSPEDDLAIREFIEKADGETKAWFLSLPVEEQLDYLNDPDRHQKILGRKA